jgi:hypothetical protein
MIGISDTAQQQEQKWAAQDNAEWQRQAETLERQGYACKGRNTRLPKFTKAGEATLILVRDLGRLNWHAVTF